MSSDTVLTAINLHHRFRIPGGRPIEVLRGANFSVDRGEKVAILGRSGSGKSTLLHILGGLLKPTSGKVVRPVNFGFVFQSYHLMDELTVLENVMLPAQSRRTPMSRAAALARAVELLGKVALGERLYHLPSELSGGERQRVALARALITDPAIVLADEPTGNLDATTGADILKMLSDLATDGKTAIVMVTHSMEAAAICERRLTLQDGVLV